ncbi:hypothetical protein WL40_08245 [Burkholderia ubonensis]|nr:hypothetical protein WJ92_08645 [Burkholderia ubonensis]KWB74725.1 hypothetical protein WL40_08245 [Burkholderia ubonensis]
MRDTACLSRRTFISCPRGQFAFVPRERVSIVRGQEFLERGKFDFGVVPLVVLLDARALGLVALLVLCGPCVARLLGDDSVIEAAVAALHPAAQRASAHLAPLRDDATVAGQLREHSVIVWQRRRGHLVPRRAPEQHRHLSTGR